MRIVFGAVLAHYPDCSAGHVCAILSWLYAFRSIGAEVWIIEEMSSDELVFTDDDRIQSVNERFWHSTISEFADMDRASLFVDGEADNASAFKEFCRSSDLFINFSGQWEQMDLVSECPCRVYLDVDPGYTQVWREAYDCSMNLENHTHYVTVGLRVPNVECVIPKNGKDWIETPPPASVQLWKDLERRSAAEERGLDTPEIGTNAWTTVTHWEGYNEIEWEGITFGNKRDSFIDLIDTPSCLALKRDLLVASDIQPEWGDYANFHSKGWRFISNRKVCANLTSYFGFLEMSRGEIGIAKKGYVSSGSGWMSDRSMGYISLGKPVVLQDTGWTQVFEPRKGWVAFQDAESLAQQISDVEADYETHCNAALELATTEFDGETILKKLLARI
ncbi:MAG: hypothetical protein AAF558_03540 [Verrucomicrobiota bacterium]